MGAENPKARISNILLSCDVVFEQTHALDSCCKDAGCMNACSKPCNKSWEDKVSPCMQFFMNLCRFDIMHPMPLVCVQEASVVQIVYCVGCEVCNNEWTVCCATLMQSWPTVVQSSAPADHLHLMCVQSACCGVKSK